MASMSNLTSQNNLIIAGIIGVAGYYYYTRVYLPEQMIIRMAAEVPKPTANVLEKMEGDEVIQPEMKPRDIESLIAHLPPVNPLASLTLQQRLGSLNPVRHNEWHDVRGAPRIMVKNTIDEEQAFMKNSRAIDSYLDKLELRGEKGDRIAVFN
jgi:hypothetical protein